MLIGKKQDRTEISIKNGLLLKLKIYLGKTEIILIMPQESFCFLKFVFFSDVCLNTNYDTRI